MYQKPMFDLQEYGPEPVQQPYKPKLKRTNHKQNQYVPQGVDLCGTPDYAMKVLIPYLNKEMIVWEPAAGEFLLTKALEPHVRSIVSTDLLTGHNFFNFEPAYWNILITNPPYTIKYRWLRRCYELGKPFALLMPVYTLAGVTALKLIDQYGIEVIFLDHRVNFKMPDKGYKGRGAQFGVAWFTWKFNIGSFFTLAHIDPPKKEK